MIVLVAVFLCVVVIYVCIVPLAPRKLRNYLYRRKDYIMTTSEYKFFVQLEQNFSDKFYIFPQIHISSLLSEKVSGQNFQAAFRHINGKSVDFVLVDKKTYKTVLAIELDDYTHNRFDRIDRDVEINKIFKQAGLPLFRVKGYDIFEIKKYLDEHNLL